MNYATVGEFIFYLYGPELWEKIEPNQPLYCHCQSEQVDKIKINNQVHLVHVK